MYQGKYVRGVIPIGDFIRYDKGEETYYEVIGDSASRAMTSIQAHVSRVKAVTKMQKFLLVDVNTQTLSMVIKVTIVKPAPPKLPCGVKSRKKAK